MPQQEEIMTAEEKINSHVIKFAILDNTLLKIQLEKMSSTLRCFQEHINCLSA